MPMSTLPDKGTMYHALVRRDSAFEGVFFAAVKTTGIFCRPTCPARKPNREHVEFFRSTRDALYAGYRPCRRCNPSELPLRLPALVKRLGELIDRSPSGRITGGRLRELGIDPSTARRQFQRYYGMTFQAYHRARRLGLALREVRGGSSVIGAQIGSGFNSSSGFYDAFRKVFGAPPSRAGNASCLLARWIETPLGAMLALADERGLHLLEFVDRRGLENEILALRTRTKSAIVPGTNRHLETVADELKGYFEGRTFRFTVRLAAGGSAFEKGVWKLLRGIPPGRTWSYERLAKKLGAPGAARAVGRANGRNCLAIVIPCHRVIRADGTLSGYGGGVWRKQWLIEHERRPTAPEGTNP